MNRNYNIAFVGLGSIARRHIKNVCGHVASCGNTYTLDLYRSSLERPLEEEIKPFISAIYPYAKEVVRDYDMVFVTNPTSFHLDAALKFRPHTKALFIEKPVFDGFQVGGNVIKLLDEIPSYVACPLRYNPVLQYVKHNIDPAVVFSVRAMSSSYLPDWRPGQDYRQTYSAHADLGGGVDIDLIHEWDYLTWLFGMPTACQSLVGKYSNLEIDSNDTALYIATNQRLSFELHLDYFGRKAQRTLDIFTQDETIQCDLVTGTITYLKQGKTIVVNAERNAYQMAEMRHFFDIVDGQAENDSNVEHGMKVLKLTKGIIQYDE